MGLLDSLLGAVMNQQAGQSKDDEGGRDMGNMGNMGGLGGLIGLVASNPQLLQIITGLLSNGGPTGGLGGLVDKFRQAGLGEAVASWIGSGPNQTVSPDQMSDALGSDTISQIAAQLGMSQGEAAGQLSELLPVVIDQLTPSGQAPAGGLGDSSELMGMLGGLLQR